MAIGRKLEGMITHAVSISTQSAEEDNDWYWARNEMEPLRRVVGELKKTSDEWFANVRTSKLGIMSQKLGSSSNCAEWLDKHKVDLDTAIAKLQRPLGELVGMHNARLRTREEISKPKKKARVGKAKSCNKPR